MVSFPSPFWREKETKETITFCLCEKEEEREKKFLLVMWKAVVGWREESLQNIY